MNCKADLVVGWRVLCADCNSNTDLHKAFEIGQGDDEDHEFELCTQCIQQREKDGENGKETDTNGTRSENEGVLG